MAKEKEKINWESLWKKGKDLDWWKTPAKDFIKILKLLNTSKMKRFYDLGCGIGRHTVLLAKAGFDVYASDISRSAISQLNDWLKKEGLTAKTYVCDMVKGPFKEKFFDFVLSYNVIYHTRREKMKKTIKHVYEILKPGGYFYFTCPSTKDGRYGSGIKVAPQTYKCDKALDKGEIHYFTTTKDLKEFLAKFKTISIKLSEGTFNNKGEERFYSDWQILVQKNYE
jgi:SAM-dependent methyltransferase